MNIEQYQLAKSKPYQQVAAWSFAAAIAVGMIGCRGNSPLIFTVLQRIECTSQSTATRPRQFPGAWHLLRGCWIISQSVW